MDRQPRHLGWMGGFNNLPSFFFNILADVYMQTHKYILELLYKTLSKYYSFLWAQHVKYAKRTVAHKATMVYGTSESFANSPLIHLDVGEWFLWLLHVRCIETM